MRSHFRSAALCAAVTLGLAAAPAGAPAPAAKDSVVAGSAPIVSSNSFDSRFGAVK